MYRRDVLKALGAVGVVATVSCPGVAAGHVVDGLVVDTRFLAACALPTPAGAWRHELDGDVTALWVNRLDQAWRMPGPALTGVTGEDALFVLEKLAWDRQRRVVLREVAPETQGPVPLVRWLIANKAAA